MDVVKYSAFGLFICLLSLNFNISFGRELEREAKVILVKSDVKIQKSGKAAWLAAKEGMILSDGDTVKTEKDSALEAAFDRDSKNVIRLEENSIAVLRGKMLKQIELPRGRIRCFVKDLGKKSSFEIKTPAAIAGARGSGWEVIAERDRNAVKAYEDEIFVQSFDENENLVKEIIVREGWEVFIEKFQPPSGMIELTSKDKEDWASWKEDLGERIEIEKSKTGEMPTQGGMPESETAGFLGKSGQDAMAAFENVESIQARTEKENEYKEDIFQIGDIKKIEARQGE